MKTPATITPPAAGLAAHTPDVLALLERIKDSLTGDQLAAMGFYDAEPFIVRACNSHAALVAALELVEAAYFCKARETLSNEGRAHIRRAVLAAFDALAAAKQA